ncbi:MAG: hypothetical protein M1600_15820 [Firmicutes bacterium]|nr:hypothetical protein [Bacillota bacterium]
MTGQELTSMPMSCRPHIGRWLAALLLVIGMVAVAQIFHVRTIIFPATAAMALGVWVLCDPEWLKRPWHIVVLPTVCAALSGSLNHSDLPTMARELLILWVVVVILTVTRSFLSRQFPRKFFVLF